MIDRTLNYILKGAPFRTLGSSRTDAMVSANEAVFELFLDQKIDSETFLNDFNQNLPFDIRAIDVQEVDEHFNIIQSPKIKEYVYLFCCGKKPHPYTAPFMAWFPGVLNIELMRAGALLFEGQHDFGNYCKDASDKIITQREVLYSRIEGNDLHKASFFPEQTYAYHVHGTGFMYNQIRLMMGELVKLGAGKTTLEQISETLTQKSIDHQQNLAPASGLNLNKITFQ